MTQDIYFIIVNSGFTNTACAYIVVMVTLFVRYGYWETTMWNSLGNSCQMIARWIMMVHTICILLRIAFDAQEGLPVVTIIHVSFMMIIYRFLRFENISVLLYLCQALYPLMLMGDQATQRITKGVLKRVAVRLVLLITMLSFCSPCFNAIYNTQYT